MFDYSLIIIFISLIYFAQVFNDYKKQYVQFASTEHENIGLKNRIAKVSARCSKVKQENTRLKSEVKFLEKQLYLQNSRLENEKELRKSVESKYACASYG